MSPTKPRRRSSATFPSEQLLVQKIRQGRNGKRIVSSSYTLGLQLSILEPRFRAVNPFRRSRGGDFGSTISNRWRTNREWQPAITPLVESELVLVGATTHRRNPPCGASPPVAQPSPQPSSLDEQTMKTAARILAATLCSLVVGCDSRHGADPDPWRSQVAKVTLGMPRGGVEQLLPPHPSITPSSTAG